MTGRLSIIQKGIYLECVGNPESTLYNTPFLGRFRGDMDPDKLQAALLEAAAVHPALNAVLREEQDGNVTLITDESPLEVPIIRLSDEEFAKTRRTLVRPFDLSGGKLARIEIYQTSSSLWLFEDIHHLIYDGSSSAVLAHDIRLALEGTKPEKEMLTVFDLAEAEDKWLSSDSSKKAQEYWKKSLSGCESVSEPERDRWEEKPGQDWLIRDISLDEDSFSALRKRAGCSTSAFFTAAFTILASVFTGREDVLFNTIYSGRDEENPNTVGMLVRTIPFFYDLPGQGGVDAFLSGIDSVLSESRLNSRYPYLKLAEEYGLRPVLEFAYQRDLTENPLINGCDMEVERIYDEAHIEAAPVIFEVCRPVPGSYRIHMGYRSDFYSTAWAESFADTYLEIVRQLFEKDSLQDITFVPENMLRKFDGFNRTASPREYTDVVTMFRRFAAKNPDAVAISYNEKSYSYKEMDDITDALSGYLAGHGIGRGSVVSILIPRNEFIPIASFGVLKAGAAYQPLDPSYPEARLGFMVEDSGAALLIADRALKDKLGDWNGPVLYTDEICDLPDSEPWDAGIRPDDLFVLLYTSGTTGNPKGVMIRHGNISELTEWADRYFEMNEDTRSLGYASYGFDAHILELYPPFTCGGSYHILSDDIRLDLAAINEYINKDGITFAIMTTQVGRQFSLAYEGGSLKDLVVGGEALVPVDPSGLCLRLHNAYGPSECTVLATIQTVDEPYHRVPIGKALENVKLYVVDEKLRRLPSFAPGELLISGPHVAAGYFNLQEKTEASFLDNPFTDEKGYERVYRTGDIVRVLSDGRYDFIGRNDGQVKVRGFRIELSEVETVIREYPGISDATVQAFADENTGMKFLAAYVVSDERIDVFALNAFIRERKPPYIVPAVTMQLDAIPLTPNLKVDKRALPLPRREEASHDKPATKEEQLAFDCVAEALGHSDFGVLTDLEEAGLSSIGAMRLNVLLSRAFHRTVRMSDMKPLHTVRDVASFFASSAREDGYAIQKSYPLSSVQQGVYVECLSKPGSTSYNIPLLLKLDPSVDLMRLKEALTATIDAHPYLKARLYAAQNGEIMVSRDDGTVIEIEELDKTDLSHGFSELVRSFRLTQEPLTRVTLIHDDLCPYLFLDMHHLIFDGESLVIFMRDLERSYAGEKLSKETFSCYETALDERQQRLGRSYEEARAYYSALLDGIDTDCLPIRDRNEAFIETGRLSAEFDVDRGRLESFLHDGRTTINALWNAAFSLTLSKFLGREDCVYTTVYNGRNDTRLTDSVGMFVHTLPVVCKLQKGESGMSFVSRTGRQLGESMSNDIYSFAEISRAFGVRSDVLFVYEGAIGTNLTVGGKPAEQVAINNPQDSKAALTFYVFDTEKGFRLECEYETEHYEEWDILSMLNSMENSLKAILDNETYEKISLLTKKQEEDIASFNNTELPVEDTDIVSLFRRTCDKFPDRTAVIFGDKKLCYSEADDLSDRIAAYILEHGIGPEEVVSILIPRSEYMAICALGVLKSGAAYQPLDPSYPSERLEFMVKDAAAKLLIADRSLTDLLSNIDIPVLLLEDIASLPEGKPASVNIRPDDLFILLYTSGTTGQPKGVMLTHKNLVNFCDWYRRYYELTQESVVAAYASFGFDADMMDLYPALTTGAAVCIVPEEMRLDLTIMNRYFEDNKVTHAFMTTQIGRMFATQIKNTCLTHLSAGGEKLVPLDPPDGYTLTNGYGPTECTIFATVYTVDRLYDRIPIGAPLSNYKTYVVDAFGHQLPPGALGELWIAGYGVGRGYLNQPEKTGQVFTQNPFCDEPGFDRVFRTGDIVRRLGDGNIDCIGRNDGQVKIRGFRVELAEIEGVIRQFDGIKDVTVQAFDDEAMGGKYIAAYVVSDDEVDFALLEGFIKDRKPPYMVPAAFKQLDSIPLNQNQKVNKRALPLPERREIGRDYVEPATPLEREICAEYASILGLEKVGAADSFFDIGGSSISAAQIVMFAMNKGYNIVYKDVFNNPSPRELARAISGMGKGGQAGAAADFDYTDINRLISFNSMEHVNEISAGPAENVILTGATGFLGIHVLYTFLNKCGGKIYCLMRRGTYRSAKHRLIEMLMYYFGENMEALFDSRVFCIEGDITDAEGLKALDTLDASIVINCAACVKHFAQDDILDRINVGGVENLVELCLRSSKRLVHISTLSIGGEMETGDLTTLREDMLYFGQNVENDYVRTKFMAERVILNARVKKDLNAVILRAGNLMGRSTDGEFQINFETNAFMRSLWAYIQLGECPFSVLENPVEFSPIDSVAEAVITLSNVDRRFSVFHLNNNHLITIADIMEAIRRHGFTVKAVSEDEFRKTLADAAKHEDEGRTVLSLVAYANKEGENLRMVGSDNRFTTNALFRLGYKWPIVDDSYLEKQLWSLDTLAFFDKL